MTEIERIDYKKVKRNKKKIFVRAFLFLLVLFFISLYGIYHWAISPSDRYPEGQIINIPEGSSLDAVSVILEESGAVKNASLFKVAAYLTENENNMKAGDYAFKKKEDLFVEASRLLEDALKHNPGNETVLAQLKNIYGALGDNENFMRVKKLIGE